MDERSVELAGLSWDAPEPEAQRSPRRPGGGGRSASPRGKGQPKPTFVPAARTTTTWLDGGAGRSPGRGPSKQMSPSSPSRGRSAGVALELAGTDGAEGVDLVKMARDLREVSGRLVALEARRGRGRIVALHYLSSILYRIRKHIRCVYF